MSRHAWQGVHPVGLAVALLAGSGGAAQATSVEFFQGPVISSNRVVGLGGAYIAVAEGADGHLLNPAAFAVRFPYTRHDDFDWDIALSWLSLGKASQDIDQSGLTGFDEGMLFDLGGHMIFGQHGYGIHLRVHRFLLAPVLPDGTTEAARYEQLLGTLGYAYAAYGGQLTVGGALTVVSATVGPRTLDDRQPDDAQELTVQGGGLLGGVLWAPHDLPYRLGVTLRTRALGEEVTGRTAIRGVTPPDRIIAPWQLGGGFAWMFGPRPFNPVADFGDWVERGTPKPDPTLPRKYLMVTADAVVTGPSDADTVGTQALLSGVVRPAGRSHSLSVRAGVESEVWVDVLRLRAGSYYEPNRHADVGRVHGTLGGDWHVGELWWDWKLSGALDVADGYVNLGLGLGFWH